MYVVSGPGVTEAAVARAIELSEEKYCAVKGMFGPQVRVTTSFRVVDVAAAAAEVAGE
jgi:putative redox protein